MRQDALRLLKYEPNSKNEELCPVTEDRTAEYAQNLRQLLPFRRFLSCWGEDGPLHNQY